MESQDNGEGFTMPIDGFIMDGFIMDKPRQKPQKSAKFGGAKF